MSQFDIDRQRAIEPDENWQLQEHRQASRQWVEPNACLQGTLRLQATFHVVFVLFGDLFQLGRQLLHPLCVHSRLATEREHHSANHDGQQNNRDRVVAEYPNQKMQHTQQYLGEPRKPTVIDTFRQTVLCGQFGFFGASEQTQLSLQFSACRNGADGAVEVKRRVHGVFLVPFNICFIGDDRRSAAPKVIHDPFTFIGNVRTTEVLRVDSDVAKFAVGWIAAFGKQTLVGVFGIFSGVRQQIASSKGRVSFGRRLENDVSSGGPTPAWCDLIAVPPAFHGDTVDAFQSVTKFLWLIAVVFNRDVHVQ